MSTVAYPDVEEALVSCMKYARSQNAMISGPILQMKAKYIWDTEVLIAVQAVLVDLKSSIILASGRFVGIVLMSVRKLAVAGLTELSLTPATDC